MIWLLIAALAYGKLTEDGGMVVRASVARVRGSWS